MSYFLQFCLGFKDKLARLDLRFGEAGPHLQRIMHSISGRHFDNTIVAKQRLRKKEDEYSFPPFLSVIFASNIESLLRRCSA